MIASRVISSKLKERPKFQLIATTFTTSRQVDMSNQCLIGLHVASNMEVECLNRHQPQPPQF